ncbi:MAG: transcriptional repressor LexA [Gammaproteobacteria bacterium]|nr:transcriptional repressor LexA [Gammaproteobacteria bacterium]
MLTTQEHNTLQFIRHYLAQYGYAPKFREIGLAIGVNSQGTVHRYVQSLQEKGYIDREKGNARGMSLVELPLVSPPTIPLVGKIAAGLPIEAIEDTQELNLAEMFMGPELFALRVSGDSMMDVGILDNDYVIIKKQPVANDGDIVVAMIDKVEATLKRFKRTSQWEVALIPENADMETMVYAAERVNIHGILVGQMRSYR